VRESRTELSCDRSHNDGARKRTVLLGKLFQRFLVAARERNNFKAH